ncbi:hypothetical protein BC941DRAFT_474170 [Chlamydoabsidia padenii]|nr:hypothetical protein BC941DRAFT_474170 [Chlamydoabsidia padenii]
MNKNDIIVTGQKETRKERHAEKKNSKNNNNKEAADKPESQSSNNNKETVYATTTTFTESHLKQGKQPEIINRPYHFIILTVSSLVGNHVQGTAKQDAHEQQNDTPAMDPLTTAGSDVIEWINISVWAIGISLRETKDCLGSRRMITKEFIRHHLINLLLGLWNSSRKHQKSAHCSSRDHHYQQVVATNNIQ